MGLKFGFISLSMCLFVLAGCAHVRNREAPEAEKPPMTLGEVLKQDIPIPVQSPSQIVAANSQADIVIQGVKLKNTRFDIPITINSRVEYWVDYFTRGKGREHFDRYLERSEFFIPYIQPLLKQNGLPEDLVYLAMIESGFNNLARSHAKAVGPWQFISATGKRYGLMVNWWVDERRDIRKSTLAAVEYLRDLYNLFQNWELAAAAYNAGEYKILRGVRRFGTRDFWVISKHRFLRPETRDYVPKIIAAALIAKNRDLFGFPAVQTKPAADEAVAGNGEIVKVIKTDKPEEGLDHNTEVVADLEDDADTSDDDADEGEASSSGPKITPATLIVPAENSLPDGALANVESKVIVARPVPTPSVDKNGSVMGEQLFEFDIQGPADLLKIARAAGLSYQTVKALNPELLRWCTPPNGGTYRIRLPSSVKEKFLATYNHDAFPRKVDFLAYKVRKGETLARIASRFGIKVDPIADLNGISSRMRLRSGVRVLLPIPNDRSRTLASLDVLDPPERRRHRHHRHHARHSYRISYKKRDAARSHASNGRS